MTVGTKLYVVKEEVWGKLKGTPMLYSAAVTRVTPLYVYVTGDPELTHYRTRLDIGVARTFASTPLEAFANHKEQCRERNREAYARLTRAEHAYDRACQSYVNTTGVYR